MRVAMLGPLRLNAEDGSPIDLGGARPRMLLARLALGPGQVVPIDALIDGLWGTAPPTDATNALQSLVSRLRRSLRGENGSAGVLESWSFVLLRGHRWLVPLWPVVHTWCVAVS